MPWTTPTLRAVREMVRGEVTSKVEGATFVGNSVLRVISDATAALAHLVLRYIDWLAMQFLPDTAETEWLDRHGAIWLTNADGSIGRKAAAAATGSVMATGTAGFIIPAGAQLGIGELLYETISQTILDVVATSIDVRALDGGRDRNLLPGDTLSFVDAIAGVDSTVTVVELHGGTDAENDEQLRGRVLFRIQKPPMGGDADDYIAWALAVAGVTRAWSYPQEMGLGTVTVRFMCDDLRDYNLGFPIDEDLLAVKAYLDLRRPVAVKDFFVVAPIPFEIDFTISGLSDDSGGVRAAIEKSVKDMLMEKAEPGQTIYASWISEAISMASGEVFHTLDFENTVMPSTGHLAILGTITYA